MRYYAEWLDGEYELLERDNEKYRHREMMRRSIRFHALLGSTLVLSDAQFIDIRTPITMLFGDPAFRGFLKGRPDFFALVADPVRGVSKSNPEFAISLRGAERLTVQKELPDDSFERAIIRLSEVFHSAGKCDVKDLVHRGGKGGPLQKILRDFGEYRDELKGFVYATEWFSKPRRHVITRTPTGPILTYDELLRAMMDTGKLTSPDADRIAKVLRIQEERLNSPELHGKRAAMRKVLGVGKFHSETWSDDALAVYLDVVHAWNCAINRRIAPDAGTLYESKDDLPLSNFRSSVVDASKWVRVSANIQQALPEGLKRFVCFDPLKVSWNDITSMARATSSTAQALQKALKTGDPETQAQALTEHAIKLGERISPNQEQPDHEMLWKFGKGALEKLSETYALNFEADYVDLAQGLVKYGPNAFRWIKRKCIVNTVLSFLSALRVGEL